LKLPRVTYPEYQINTEKARGPYDIGSGATCGPWGCSWNTLN